MFLVLSSCSFHEASLDWTEQLAAGGPCFEADLTDGLDETDTAELHALYACLDQGGALAALGRLDRAFDAPARALPAGLVLARRVNALGTLEVSLVGLVDEALALLDDRAGVERALHLGLELAYARSWSELSGEFVLDAQSALDAGVLVPALETAGPLASAVLDDDLAALAPVRELLVSDALLRVSWTAAGVGLATDPVLAGLADRWPAGASDALRRVQERDNDRWAHTTGNSLRDLLGAARGARADLTPSLSEILSDPVTGEAVAEALADAVARGRLAALPGQLAYLAAIDADGGGLAGGEASALAALVRLLHDTNGPVDCSVDLGLTTLDFSFGNLAVALLEALADADPEAVAGGVSLLGDIAGAPLTDAVLTNVADSGLCPMLDDQVIADLHAIDRLNDPAAADLVVVFLAALRALDGHFEALADAAGVAHEHELVWAAEEALRDLEDSALVADLLAALPALLDPSAHHDPAVFPAGVEPVAFDDLWAWSGELLGGTELDTLDPLVASLLEQDAAWTTLDHLADLLDRPDALAGEALTLLAEGLEADPELDALATLAEIDDETARDLLLLVECEGLRAALGETAETDEGALPWLARLARGDTLAVLSDTLALLRDLLPEPR